MRMSPGKQIFIYFPACGRENSAEGFGLYEMVKASCMAFGFFDGRKRAASAARFHF